MGWRPREAWGEEVIVSDARALEDAGYKAAKPVGQWTALGIRRTDGSALPDRVESVSLLAPGGRTGPAFVTYPNFRVIMKWNASTNYALAVGLLADRLAGGPPLHAKGPRVTRYLRADGREIQQRLRMLGYPIERVDGVLGEESRLAIRNFVRDTRLPLDGEPDQALLEALRAASNQAGTGELRDASVESRTE
jgi:membrane-bound lytic murein transglycosylase B